MKKLQDLWNKLMHNEALKRRIYIIIFESDTPAGKLFDVALILFILLSILIVITESIQGVSEVAGPFLRVAEYLFTFFFTAEYVLRLYCSPSRRGYALSFFGIVDLLATLPLYLTWIFGPARYLLIIRTFRLIRVFRIFKLFNFLEEGRLLLHSLYASSAKIGVFFLFVLILVISIGTIMFMVEGQQPDTAFNNIPNCIYWAVVTLTTVGYGDITPVTPVGRFLSAVVMLMGYTIIAVPTGIVSATMLQTHQRKREEEQLEGPEKPNRLSERKWEVMDSEYLIRRPWLTARRDTVKLPNGTIIPEYYVLEYPNWVNVIAITDEGKFVLVRQYRHALGETRYELCAGVCDEGEEPITAAQRELFEETGYSGGHWKLWMTLSANASSVNNLTYCYLATDVKRTSTQHLDPTEDLTVHVVSRKQLYSMLKSGEFRQALMTAPLWKYYSLNREL